MRATILENLKRILGTNRPDTRTLEAALKDASGEKIILPRGRFLHMETALYNYELFRPKIRRRVEDWANERFAGLERLENDAIRPGGENASIPIVPVPHPDQQASNITKIQMDESISEMEQNLPDPPREAKALPGATFREDAFDRFLEVVSKIVCAFRMNQVP